MICQLVVNTGTRMTDRPFSYRVPERLEGKIQAGQSVFVPFGRGNRLRRALVLEVSEDSAQESPPVQLKEVDHIAEGQPILSEEAMALAFYMVRHDLADYASAFQTVMPPGAVGSYKPVHRSYFSLTEAGKQAQPAKNAFRQQAVLDRLREVGEEGEASLLQATGASRSTLTNLVGKGWLDQSDRRVYRIQNRDLPAYKKLPLTPDQEAVYKTIREGSGGFLISGVTGSGKTEIYLHLVEDCLKAGKQAIVLVPEISLTPQTIARFEGRFGPQVAVLHSRLNTNERFEEWEKIDRGEVAIAIGARSAIFAPFKNLGLIVIDEEHDSSYISEKNPKYHTYDIARFRANWHHARLVLGSATPSVESLYRADQGELTRLDLPNRVQGRPMPEMVIVDMREELKSGNRTMFSRPLYQAMQEALAKGNQVILFLNKRGHSSFVFCRACGYVYRCDACDVAMTYHKYRDRLVCHYCGREKSYGRTCPNCGSRSIREFGAGTEQLEEEVRRLFPNQVLVRADADTMGSKKAYSRVYQDMMTGKTDILLGTQMIAKGFDFPKVTVVGIMAADISLNLPDIRAEERTYQLVTQVAGRSGRGKEPGQVFIQTYKPDNPALVYAAKHELDPFYAHTIRYRQNLFYPPISHELAIRIQSTDRRAALNKGREIRSFLEKKIHKDIPLRALQGPSPSVLERVNRKYRFAILYRTRSREELENLGRDIFETFPTSKEINIILAIDPDGIY